MPYVSFVTELVLRPGVVWPDVSERSPGPLAGNRDCRGEPRSGKMDEETDAKAPGKRD